MANYFLYNPPATFGAVRTYFFPKTRGSDPLVTILRDVVNNNHCKGRSTVRVAMALFTRWQISEQLLTLAEAGCDVQVVYGTAKTPVLKHLNNTKIRTWRFTRDRLHSKYLTIEFRTPGQPAVQKFVWTGSPNYSVPALRNNDETLLRIHDGSIHDAFVANFETLTGAPGVTPVR